MHLLFSSLPTAAIVTISMCVSNTAVAQVPIERVGDCPTGYFRSGDYCKPFSSTIERKEAAIVRQGKKCPLGWYRAGNYCKSFKGSGAEPEVIEKIGDECPNGFYKHGDSYCKRI